jgi:hypothetical protein
MSNPFWSTEAFAAMGVQDGDGFEFWTFTVTMFEAPEPAVF